MLVLWLVVPLGCESTGGEDNGRRERRLEPCHHSFVMLFGYLFGYQVDSEASTIIMKLSFCMEVKHVIHECRSYDCGMLSIHL